MLKTIFIISCVLIVRSQTCIPGCHCGAVLSTCLLSSFHSSLPNNIPKNVKILTIAGKDTNPNSLRKISMMSFPGLQHLTLRYCGITEIDKGAFSGLPVVRTLSLAYNNISKIDQLIFQGLSGLKTLDLTGNENCKIQNGAFDGLSSLCELLLAELNLNSFDESLIKPLMSLRKLDLHGNKLKSLKWRIITSLKSLTYLDISRNKLTSIPSTMAPLFSHLKSIFLADNPWVCDSDIKWLKNHNASFSIKASWASLICDLPNDLKYISLVNVPDSKLDRIAPKIVYCDGSKVTVDEGSSVLINCSFEGKPKPTVTWINPTGTIYGTSSTKNDHVVFQNSSLLILKVSIRDQGNWTLSASSTLGEDQRAVELRVILSTTTTTITTTITTKPTKTTLTSSSTTTTNKVMKSTTAATPTHVTSVVKMTNSSKPEEPPNMLMYYAAGGGGGLLFLIILIIICSKKCKKDVAVENEGFDTVRSPRKSISRANPTRVNVAPRRQAYT